MGKVTILERREHSRLQWPWQRAPARRTSNPPSVFGDLLFAERNETRKNLVPKRIVRNREMCSAFINDAPAEINKYRITLG